MGDPATIPHDSGLAEILSDAIAGIISDQKNMIQITAVQFRLENIKDIISGLRSSRRLNSSTGRYWENEFAIHEETT